MSSDQNPSDKLQLRLAERRQGFDHGRRYVDMAEDIFKDPTSIVSAAWRKQNVGEFIISRAAHQFSAYDAFIYKLIIVLAGLQKVDKPTAEDIIASATYADGKCVTRRASDVNFGSDFPALHKLLDKGFGNAVPQPLTAHAQTISDLIAASQPSGSAAVDQWLARQMGLRDSTATTSSPIFSETATPYALPLGLSSETNRTVFYTGEASLLTVAPPGRGKTQCHVLPTLHSYLGPVIALDIKGECYSHTSTWRNDNVGPSIYFNPADPSRSARYNPLSFVDDDPDELWESSRFLADLLVLIRSQHDPSWEAQGKDLLTLIIAFVVATEAPAQRTMGRVLDFVAGIGLEDMMGAVGDDESPFPSAMRRMARRYFQMAEKAPKQFQGILSGASQHLQLWEGPKLEAVTSRSDWRPEDFRAAPYPTLYLCVPPNAIETYAPVLRVIIGQHVRRLMHGHERAQAPILFLLDELPRLGKMEPIREALEVGRSYGIKLWMIAQYVDQILSAYPGVGSGMIESCEVRMYMSPPLDTAERLSKAFGTTRSVFNNKEEPALLPTDITGPSYRDAIFVEASSEKPRVLNKKFFYKN